MGLLDKLWDDVVAGPQPDRGLGKLRNSRSLKVTGSDPMAMDGDQRMRSVSQSINIKRPLGLDRLQSLNDETMASTPTGSTPASPSSLASPVTGSKDRDSAWRLYHPGIGRRSLERHESAKYDNVTSSSPSVYDWMYKPESRNKWQ